MSEAKLDKILEELGGMKEQMGSMNDKIEDLSRTVHVLALSLLAPDECVKLGIRMNGKPTAQTKRTDP